MNPLTELKSSLIREARTAYTISEKLFRRVTDPELSWKPQSGKNWMTMGQLLMHCASYGCGKAVQGFVNDRWDIPENNDDALHIPTVDTLPSVQSVEQALDLLSTDRHVALQCLEKVSENDLLTKKVVAPWGGPDLFLYQHLSLMIRHLEQHKGQLFYYLKLMGKDVSTKDLWGEE